MAGSVAEEEEEKVEEAVTPSMSAFPFAGLLVEESADTEEAKDTEEAEAEGDDDDDVDDEVAEGARVGTGTGMDREEIQLVSRLATASTLCHCDNWLFDMMVCTLCCTPGICAVAANRARERWMVWPCCITVCEKRLDGTAAAEVGVELSLSKGIERAGGE